MTKEILTHKQQDIVYISSYTAKGDLKNLEKALSKGLDDKMTVNEIKEILVQMYAYCGFPRSLNGLSTFMKVVDSRADKHDITDEAGKVLPQGTDKFAYGDKVQVELTGDHATGKLFDFAPVADQYLKEHLFDDIFARGILTYQERELATIGALSSLTGVEPQLKAHIQMGKNTGLTDEQIAQALKLTGLNGGMFGLGSENTAYAKYFIGTSYLNPLTKEGVRCTNVTFETKCRNNRHIHRKGGQILIVTDGRGYYQEWGKPARNCTPETRYTLLTSCNTGTERQKTRFFRTLQSKSLRKARPRNGSKRLTTRLTGV